MHNIQSLVLRDSGLRGNEIVLEKVRVLSGESFLCCFGHMFWILILLRDPKITRFKGSGRVHQIYFSKIFQRVQTSQGLQKRNKPAASQIHLRIPLYSGHEVFFVFLLRIEKLFLRKTQSQPNRVSRGKAFHWSFGNSSHLCYFCNGKKQNYLQSSWHVDDFVMET